ncbi:MAG: phosphoglucosamine mutase [Acidobacteria bacterium]|jgi:phosphoglucosamine mutase|nr:MAG: phosphoglucosamine mutase [Acidobacteriota bacterium]HYK50777.1 phosphoglucosamine mutase [Terriglobales bacterium]
MTQTRQLFGTDGIRGVAGEFPLTRESTYLIGRALGHDLIRGNAKARVVIGQDTRESSRWIADRVWQGLASVGIEVRSAGVITTPGVAYLARSQRFDAGVVISASHNPWTDNGIKVFSGDGYKLPDAHELAIEKEIFTLLQGSQAPPHTDSIPPLSSLPGDADLRQAYVRWLASNIETDLSRLRLIVDCANGAAAVEAPELFRALGIQATYLHSSPDGQNINEQCGALHPETVGRFMAENKGEFDLGVTFDGDADRALFCDAEGRVVNGDTVLLIAAREMQSGGSLANTTVVATTMSNMGLELALKRSGIHMLRANVGDKYVLEEMQRVGATLGGEQSGHILFRDGEATTGDGLLTALRVMEIMVRTGKSLADLAADLKIFPQTIRNVRVREKKPFSQIPVVQQAITSAERELDGNGRVVVRYSGTEALARVMIEAESKDQMERIAGSIVEAIRSSLGS